jgi:hypothetical protein
MSLATLITSLRTLANDTTTANRILRETLTGVVDGSNKNFYLQQRNIVTGSVYLTYTGVFRTQTGFTVTLADGLVAFGSAPASGLEILADYNFQWFNDTDHTEFLNRAANHLSANTDPTAVDVGLEMALMQYALGYFYQRRAAEYAHRYSSSSMGTTAQVDTVTKNFAMLAKSAFDTADKFRLAFYQRQGQREAPASGTQTYGIDPYTPQR